jgi:hypothetical protein
MIGYETHSIMVIHGRPVRSHPGNLPEGRDRSGVFDTLENGLFTECVEG